MTDISVELGVADTAAPSPSFRQALKVWAEIGLLSFGGPTAQIALMHRVVVDERRWLSEQQFLNALSFCMLLPGPEAMQLATYAGWRLHGLKGGLAAGLLFVLPGALLVLALAAIYAAFGQVPLMQAIFFGIKAAVVVIVVEALLRVARRALKRPAHWVLAGLSFIAIFFLSLPFPLVIAAAAAGGFMLAQPSHEAGTESTASPRIGMTRIVGTIVVWGLIWLLPLGALALALGWDHVLVQLGVFFSKLAVVTFGGAYAVLAYMAQEVVQSYGWLDAGEMLDGLGLAETTNGPLILVTEFVGYLAAYRSGDRLPILMGLAGAVVTLWVTFTPCFLWVFAGAPYIEHLQRQPKLRGALEGVMAAVVGVIFNLTVWFGLHVFFKTVAPITFGPLTLWTPELATIELGAVLLASLAAIGLFRFHLSLPVVLAAAGVFGFVWQTWL
jgi:chromate transporter